MGVKIHSILYLVDSGCGWIILIKKKYIYFIQIQQICLRDYIRGNKPLKNFYR